MYEGGIERQRLQRERGRARAKEQKSERADIFEIGNYQQDNNESPEDTEQELSCTEYKRHRQPHQRQNPRHHTIEDGDSVAEGRIEGHRDI